MTTKKGGSALSYPEWKKRYADRIVQIIAPTPDMVSRWKAASESEGIPLSRWLLNRIEVAERKLERVESTSKDLRVQRDMTEQWRTQAEKSNAEVVRLTTEKAALEKKSAVLESIIETQIQGKVGTRPLYLEAAEIWGKAMLKTWPRDRLLADLPKIRGLVREAIKDGQLGTTGKPLSHNELKQADRIVDSIVKSQVAAEGTTKGGK